MATQALHRDAFVSRIDDLLPHGVVRMLGPIMAGFAEFDSGSLLQEEGIIRPMGKMAAFAIPLLDRVMCHRTLDYSSLGCRIFLLFFFGKLFLLCHRVDMTLSTQAFHITHQKLLLRGGMGFMAVQTAHLVNQRPVDPVFVKCVIHHGAMASPAQLKPCFLRL